MKQKSATMLNNFEKAKECAFWYINKKRYTKKELIDRLVRREYDRDIAIQVANYLEELQYIDDSDYVRRYIKDAVNLKKHGIIRIKNDLRLKGIDSNTFDKIMSEMNVDCTGVLADLVETKAASINLNDEKQKNRLIGFLLRRGYNHREIFDALNKYLNK